MEDTAIKGLPPTTYGTGLINPNGVAFYRKTALESDIGDRISTMYRSFLSRYSIVPNILCLSASDYFKLINYLELRNPIVSPFNYLGMDVQRVYSDKSYVALALQDLK